jgi:prepilin-type N-terminal cleavage/methylation domain-containing protein
MTKKFNRGFTLIELLVVIAIIGILSSVVLASLNTARSKGANAAVKSNLNNIRAQAELFYDGSSQSYAGVCDAASSAAIPGIKTGVAAAATAGGNGTVQATNAVNIVGGTSCSNAAGSWVAQSALKVAESGNAYWCVDNSGTSKADNTVAPANATACP